MGPTWVLSAPGGPHIGPINVDFRDCISHCVHVSVTQIFTLLLLSCHFIRESCDLNFGSDCFALLTLLQVYARQYIISKYARCQITAQYSLCKVNRTCLWTEATHVKSVSFFKIVSSVIFRQFHLPDYPKPEKVHGGIWPNFLKIILREKVIADTFVRGLIYVLHKK